MVTDFSRVWGTLRPAAPHVLAFVLLALALCLVFWRVTVRHQVLSPADLVFGSYPWAADPPDGYTGPSNPWQSDDAYLYYPRRYSYYNSTEDSWWQDEYLHGAENTFSSDFLGLEFYPPALFYELLPFPVANGFFHLTILLIAGFSMYLLLWEVAFPWFARVYGGLLFMLNGHFMVWLGAFSLPAMLGLIPLMLFGFERFIRTREPPWLVIPATCIALQIYLAYIPAWVVTGVILGIYGLMRLIPPLLERLPKEAAVRGAAYVGAGILGITLGAYSLVPSLVSALSSDYQQDRTLGLGHYPLEQSWSFFFPDFFGGPRNWIGFNGNYPEWIAYTGVSAMPLVLLGFWHMRRHWLGWFSVALVVFSATQVYGIFPLKELAHLPGLKQVAVGRWLFGFDVAVALMAPAGIAALLDLKLSDRTRRILLVAVGGVVLLTVVVVLGLYLERQDTQNWTWMTEGRDFIPRPWDTWEHIETASTHFHRQVAFLALGCALAAAALLRPRYARALCGAIVVLALADMFVFAQHYNGTVARANLYPETPGIDFLQADDGVFRIAPIGSDGINAVFPGYTANLYGLRTITGYDHYRDEDYTNFIEPLQSQNDKDIIRLYGYITLGMHRLPLDENRLRMLNVKYIVTPPTGLYEAVGGQTRNTTAYPVFGDQKQGQIIPVAEDAEEIELLLATGGRQGIGSDVIVRIMATPEDTSIPSLVTLHGPAIRDNQWSAATFGIPDPLRGKEIYIEVEAPDATADAPLYLWGIPESESGAGTRVDNGEEAEGSITYRLLRSPDWAARVYGDGEFGESDIDVYQLNDPLPLAWGVSGATVLPDEDAVLARIGSEAYDPGNEVLFSEVDAPTDMLGGNERARLDTEVTDYEPDAVTVQTNFAASGYLVISNRYDSDWQVEVDGDDAELLRADAILQAVQVPAGAHTVHLSFEPDERTWGSRISIVALVLVAGGLVGYWGWRYRRRQMTSDST